jgi:molybdate transport system substrate-binding protein
MLSTKRSALALSFLAFITACGVSPNLQTASTNSPDPVSSDNAPAVTLTVGAAADLQYAFQELGELFEAETGTKVDFNFGSTGQLAQQVERGAPIDLFAAANQSFVEDLDAKGRVVSDTKEIYGRGRIVLWSRNDSPLDIEQMSLEDLLDPEITRVAIANPDHAPYGIAAREALESIGIWEEIQPKLVLGENIRQTLQYAETGNVDAAIVALSLAVVVDGQWQLLPEELHNPLDQMLAVVKGTPHEAEARDFAEFINSTKGRPIMQQYGFVLPGEEPVQ